jgi:TPR repeat protein
VEPGSRKKAKKTPVLQQLRKIDARFTISPTQTKGVTMKRFFLAGAVCSLLWAQGALAVSFETERALEYKRLADAGDVQAMTVLGSFYRDGNQVPKNTVKAVKWFTLAAERGDIAAQVYLAFMFFKGEGVPVSKSEALNWWMKAADNGDSKSQLLIGCMYLQGDGVDKSPSIALSWFQKAAELGELAAQVYVATLLQKGDEVPQDLATAAFWWEKAAGQGSAAAMSSLAHMLQHGIGVAKDLPQAYAWYKMAGERARTGRGRHTLNRKGHYIRRQMTSDEKKRATQLHKEWNQRVPK